MEYTLESLTGTPESPSSAAASIPKHSYTGTKGKIVDFLGSGLSPEIVSSAVGVTAGYISQLLSDDEFAKTVTAQRLARLQIQADRDGKYDSLEDLLLEKLENVIDFMCKPHEIIKALTFVNGAKRRVSGLETNTIANTNTVINLILPTQMISHFEKDINNHIIKTGDKALITLPSGSLEQLVTDSLVSKKGSAVSITDIT